MACKCYIFEVLTINLNIKVCFLIHTCEKNLPMLKCKVSCVEISVVLVHELHFSFSYSNFSKK